MGVSVYSQTGMHLSLPDSFDYIYIYTHIHIIGFGHVPVPLPSMYRYMLELVQTSHTICCGPVYDTMLLGTSGTYWHEISLVLLKQV